MSDLVELLLQGQLAQLVQGEADKNADPVGQHAQSVGKGQVSFGFTTLGFRWIGKTPMGSHWLAGPYRTDFLRRVVADCENEIELWRVGSRELIPWLRAQLEVS